MLNSLGKSPAAQTPDCCILFTWLELIVYVLQPEHSTSPPPLEYIRPRVKITQGELRGVIKGQHGGCWGCILCLSPTSPLLPLQRKKNPHKNPTVIYFP